MHDPNESTEKGGQHELRQNQGWQGGTHAEGIEIRVARVRNRMLWAAPVSASGERRACVWAGAGFDARDLTPTFLDPSTGTSSAAGSAAPLTLGQELGALARRLPNEDMTLGDLMKELGARVSALLILVCALPFCAPITIPGLSTPFGLVIAFLAARYAAGLPPWLPRRLRQVVLPPKVLARILEVGGKIISWFEARLKRRWAIVVDARWKLRLHAIVIVLAALVLMLPLPPFPPFTNTLPALVIVILTLSTLERDGAGVIFGHGLFVGTLIYFAFWAAIIWEAITRIAGKFGL